MVRKGTVKPSNKKELRIGTWYWLKYVKEEGKEDYVEENRDEFKIKSAVYLIPQKRYLKSNLWPPNEIKIQAKEFVSGAKKDINIDFKTKLEAAFYVKNKRQETGKVAQKSPMKELVISLDELFKWLSLCHVRGTVELSITPPDDANSNGSASPSLGKDRENKPGNSGARKKFDAMYRPFTLAIDFHYANGFYRISDVRNATGIKETYWHAELDPFLEEKNSDEQCIMVDWKPDWLRKIYSESVTRPLIWDRKKTPISTLILHNVSGGRKSAEEKNRNYPPMGPALNTFFRNIRTKHCDLKKNSSDKCKKDGYKKDTIEKDGKNEIIYSKIVTNRSGAHYLVDVDGHVTKLAHESWATQHGGGTDSKNWSSRNGSVNNRSVGIEHCIFGNNPDFYESLISASLKLTEAIVQEHRIPPWNMIGHNCVVPGKKLCPALDFPWNRYESKKVSFGNLKIQLAQGANIEIEIDVDTIYDGFFRDDKEKFIGENTKKSIVQDLQADLADIGFMFHKISGKYDKGTQLSVERFGLRFMNTRHKAGGISKKNSIIFVNLATALRIKQVQVQRKLNESAFSLAH